MNEEIMRVIRYAYFDHYEVDECLNLLRSKNLHVGITYEMVEDAYMKICIESVQ